MKTNKISFAFVDEVGTGKDPNQPFFGVGMLVVNLKTEETLSFVRKSRGILMEAICNLNCKEGKFEFKFKHVTGTSLPYYLRLIRQLKKSSNGFHFNYILERPSDKQWEQYLKILKCLIVKNKNSNLIILADYLHQPKKATLTLDSLEKEKNVEKILQIEGQTSIFLQIADILLGAVNFLKLKRKGENKMKIAEKAIEIVRQIKKVDTD